MKFLSILFLAILLSSGCEPTVPVPVTVFDGVEYFSLETYYDVRISKMKSPVTLIGKDKTFDCWGVTLKDANGEILTIGNMVSTANNIGSSRSIGDVIK